MKESCWRCESSTQAPENREMEPSAGNQSQWSDHRPTAAALLWSVDNGPVLECLVFRKPFGLFMLLYLKENSDSFMIQNMVEI